MDHPFGSVLRACHVIAADGHALEPVE